MRNNFAMSARKNIQTSISIKPISKSYTKKTGHNPRRSKLPNPNHELKDKLWVTQ